jgi:hypothetical protein
MLFLWERLSSHVITSPPARRRENSTQDGSFMYTFLRR